MKFRRANVQQNFDSKKSSDSNYDNDKYTSKNRMVGFIFLLVLFSLLTIPLTRMQKNRKYVFTSVSDDISLAGSVHEDYPDDLQPINEDDLKKSLHMGKNEFENQKNKKSLPKDKIKSQRYDSKEFDSQRYAMQNQLTKFEDGNPIGYVRIPKFRSERLETSDDGKLHIIFSSGCNLFQHWQAEFLLASAWLVGQRGRITRLVSGCYDKRAETVSHRHQTFPRGKNDRLVPVAELNRSVNEEFGLYITPAFDGAIDFPWINKPSSINYFLKNARPELDRVGETVIVILDPDFVFLKPISQIGLSPSNMIHDQSRNPGANDPADVVIKGRPVAQRYGIEGGWVHRFNVKKITGDANSNALKYSSHDAAKYFSVGPPLMLHVEDADTLSTLWLKYMRPVLEQETDILADMWAYSIAAAEIDLHHTILDHYMISTWGSRGQAFPWINEWKTMSCLDPKVPSGSKSPNFIHLASNFKAPRSREWMFHKGHVPADILSCDTPLIKESPDNLWKISDDRKTKQSAWVLCNTVSRLNKILMLYKKKFCPNGFESRKLVRLIQRKTKDRSCNTLKDKWCWPLCQIEDLPDNWRSIDS